MLQVEAHSLVLRKRTDRNGAGWAGASNVRRLCVVSWSALPKPQEAWCRQLIIARGAPPPSY
jgi:hypothetical protein